MAWLITGVSKNHVYAESNSAFFNEKKHKKTWSKNQYEGTVQWGTLGEQLYNRDSEKGKGTV